MNTATQHGKGNKVANANIKFIIAQAVIYLALVAGMAMLVTVVFGSHLHFGSF